MTMRPAPMKSLLLSFAALLIVACAAPAPTQPPVATAPALPSSIAIRPGPDDPSAMVTPASQAGTWEVGQAGQYTLGHCGLASPIDLDGSLWDPTAGHDGNGREPTAQQVTELLGPAAVSITLISPRSAVLQSPLGAIVFLDRLDGPRAYLLCD